MWRGLKDLRPLPAALSSSQLEGFAVVSLKMSLETGGLLSPAWACAQSPLGQEMGGVPIVQCGRRGLGKRFGRSPLHRLCPSGHITEVGSVKCALETRRKSPARVLEEAWPWGRVMT